MTSVDAEQLRHDQVDDKGESCHAGHSEEDQQELGTRDIAHKQGKMGNHDLPDLPETGQLGDFVSAEMNIVVDTGNEDQENVDGGGKEVPLVEVTHTDRCKGTVMVTAEDTGITY